MKVRSHSWMPGLLGLGLCLPLTAAPAAAQSSEPAGQTAAESPAARKSPFPARGMPIDVGKLLNDLAPGVRLGARGVEVETNGVRIDTRGGVTVDLDTPRGHVRISEVALRQFVDAGQLLREQHYERALDSVNRALQQMPLESRFHQLRSLILFGQRDYVAAAEAAHQALEHGSAWDWQTLHKLYANANAYAVEYKGLQRAVRDNPDSAELHFLLAYHHLMLGHLPVALDELRHVGHLLPEDRLVGDLIQRLADLPSPLGRLD